MWIISDTSEILLTNMSSNLKLSDACKRKSRRIFGASMDRNKSESTEKSVVEDRRLRYFGPRAARLREQFSTPYSADQAVLLDSGLK